MPEGTADNVATGGGAPAAASSGAVAAPASSGGGHNITSGTASEALIKAATAASSAADAPATAGDTPHGPGSATPGATAGAIVQPSAEGSPASAAGNRGPIPFERHEAALRNARTEAATEALKPFAWAQGKNPEHIQASYNLVGRLTSDPVAFARQLIGELREAGQWKDETAPATAATTVKEWPKPSLRSEDGKHNAYTDQDVKAILAIEGDKLRAELRAEMAPAMEFVQTSKGMQAQQAITQQAQQAATAVLTEMRELPHFKENEAAIGEKLGKMDPAIRRRIGSVAALYRCYNQMLAEKVFPSIQQSAEQKVRENNARKAATSMGTAHPVDQGGGDRKKVEIKGVSALARHMESLASAASS